ncbi:MAG: hypothetical protein H0V89_14895 [Deltaproteobacteria bacterium]|nr:hypothetical protein [Deltaproteobacteria bacterium]
MILLLDGLSILYRAFHALPPMSTAAGEPTSALYGFSSLLVKLLREEAPVGLALALDTPAPTVRHAEFPEYKAGRARMPDGLRAQIDELPVLAAAMGVPVHRVPGKEADDLLATLARRIAEPTLVVSGDTDRVQVVDDRTTMLFIGRRKKDHVRYTPASVQERYGFEPRLVPTYKAMVGDPADNLPGISGFGAATARKLCATYGDAAAILAARPDPRLTEALPRWEALGRLDGAVPLAAPLWAPVDRDGLRRWFGRWEFKSLLARIPGSSG